MAPSLIVDSASLLVGGVGAVWDARSGRIPNRLTLPAGALAIVLHVALGGLSEGVESILGLLLAGLLPFVLSKATRGRAIGGGDVKLFAALGALEGPLVGLQIELCACILLSTFALLRLAFAGKLLRVLGNALRLFANPLLPARFRKPLSPEALTELRMGPAILGAVFYACFANQLARWVPWLAL